MKDKSKFEEVEMISNVGLGEHVVMDKKECVKWLDLPRELWILIAEHLNTTIDILRFRSVCKTWRYILSRDTLYIPQVCIPLYKDELFLLQTKVYRLERSLSHPPQTGQGPSISPSQGWIARFAESKFRQVRGSKVFTNFPYDTRVLKFCMMKPQTGKQPLDPWVNIHNYLNSWSRDALVYSNPMALSELNLMDFRVVELIETYTVNLKSDKLSDGGGFMAVPGVRKVVLVPSFPGRMVFALYDDGKLGFCKIGEENWNIVNDGITFTRYDDIMLHKGYLYLVDQRKIIFQLDVSSLKLAQFSSKSFPGKYQQLVECGGSIHVVDMDVYYSPFHFDRSRVEYIKVYKFDGETKEGEWLHVTNLGDSLFIFSKEFNISVSSQDYYGFHKNSIYFNYASTPQCFNLAYNGFL